MSLSSELTDLSTNLAAAKAAVTTKGGTVGDTGLAGLASEIDSIPSGGGAPIKTDWGVLRYYSEWTTTCTITSAYGCTIESVDQSILVPYVTAQGDNFDGFRFNDGYWYSSSDWGYEHPIANEDMPTTTGITISGTPSQYAEIYIRKDVTIDTTSSIVTVELNSTEYSALGSLNNSHYTTSGGDAVPVGAIEGFIFGTNPTTVPSYFLGGEYNLVTLDMTYAMSITEINSNFLYSCRSFNQPISLPSSVETVGQYFMPYCSSFNQPVALPSSLTSIGTYFLTDCSVFNQPIVIPDGITSIQNSFLERCIAFNQTITIPASVTSIGDKFLRYCDAFDSPIIFAPGSRLTSIGEYFLDGNSSYSGGTYTPKGNFNQPLTLPDSLTTLGGYFLRLQPKFNSKLVLPNSLRTIGSNFLSPNLAATSSDRVYSTFAQSLTIPSSVTSIDIGFLRGAHNFTGPLIVETTATPVNSGYSLVTNYTTDAAYVNGVTIKGTRRSNWLSALPNQNVSDRYRKVIDGGA